MNIANLTCAVSLITINDDNKNLAKLLQECIEVLERSPLGSPERDQAMAHLRQAQACLLDDETNRPELD